MRSRAQVGVRAELPQQQDHQCRSECPSSIASSGKLKCCLRHSTTGIVQLKTVLDKVLALPGAEKPLVALFFRRQMVTIISRALRELDIVPLSSQRCFALLGMDSVSSSCSAWHMLQHFFGYEMSEVALQMAQSMPVVCPLT